MENEDQYKRKEDVAEGRKDRGPDKDGGRMDTDKEREKGR